MNMLKRNCYMTSILRMLTILSLLLKSIKNTLKFDWNDKFYKYEAFPNALAICPRKFT